MKDLSTELPLPTVKDESYDLILAFNGMIQRLNRSFEREKRISANIAHEFRTPLAVLMIKYDVLEMKPTRSIQDYEQVLAASREKVEYLTKITSDLLDLYRGTQENHPQTLNFQQLLESIADNFSVRAREKEILISVDCPAVDLLADPLLLGQMLGNFLDNAVKYN